MAIITSPFDSLLCIFVILLGAPVYYLFVVMEKPKSVQIKIGKLKLKNLITVLVNLKFLNRCFYTVNSKIDIFRFR